MQRIHSLTTTRPTGSEKAKSVSSRGCGRGSCGRDRVALAARLWVKTCVGVWRQLVADVGGWLEQRARCGSSKQECAAAAAGLGQSRQPTGGPPLDRGRAPQFSVTQPLWDNQLSASFVFHAPLCLALLQTRRFSFQFQTGRTTTSRPHTHLFHQMTFLSPRPSHLY